MTAVSSSLVTSFHFFPLAAAVLLPTKLLQIRTLSVMLPVMNRHKASSDDVVTGPDAGPGQLLNV